MATAYRVLVIDDDNTVCELVSALARTMGLNCEATKDPATFLDRVTPETSLILLDLMMPGMDGIEVLRLLGERRCKARILLMSGMDKRVLETAEKLAHSLGLAVVGHLQKPFPLPELKGVLESVAAMEAPASVKAIPVIAVSDEQVRNAVKNGEFLNYYQPQISLKTGDVMGVEALARWRHPERGMTLPENFLARLEALDLMDDLCWSTAELAVAEAKQFTKRNGELLRLSINASMRSLRDLEFPDALVTLARKYEFPVEMIAVEITESVLMSELSRTLDVLTRLRMKNFQLSIDDFGSGYAMMRQLQNVPATELKIDRSIVEKMHLNDSDRVMVEKIVEMGHGLKLSVLAEGVMTQEQFQLLRTKGCDGAQGYWFSYPLPADAMKKWLATYELR
ncbi:MAG TPA: EAL domain-containing response regulator [Terracidiphilus sp.]|jgi:EAL domain-containing protein (putative c-di-GMP-specific phosphodiesterase class I)|nr:EAL domain-containing response regulator [Terracidiphilus sp.]